MNLGRHGRSGARLVAARNAVVAWLRHYLPGPRFLINTRDRVRVRPFVTWFGEDHDEERPRAVPAEPQSS